MEQQEIDRERIAGDYRNSIIASVEHDESKVPEARNLREQHQEYGKKLDEDEASLKAQYGECGCAEQTGLDADGYRHQVISDYTQEQLAAQGRDANAAESYWDESNQEAVGDGNVQDASDQYWNSQGAVGNDNGVGLDAEDVGANHSGVADVQSGFTDASADNSLSNKNSL